VKEMQQKLSKILLFLLLFLIPTQLGKHFWFDWSMVLGIRIDYLSPTLYLVDLIWIVLFILNLIKPSVFRTSPLKKETFLNFKHFLVFGFVVINILLAQNRWIAVYKWARIGQLVWFGYYVFKNKNLVEKMLIKIIPWWIVSEGLLAVAQIAKGGSLNGVWWWLGERAFDFNTIGVAQMSVANNGIVRAYGTFSHPNSLAGFLLVSLILWVKYKSSPSSIYNLPPSSSFTRGGNVLWWGVVWLGIIGIILTGSRTIWLLGLISIVWLLWGKLKNIKNKGKTFALVIAMLIMVYKMIDYNYPIGNFLGGWDENGMIKRGQLNLASIEMVKKSPFFGVGAGNFLVNLPEYQKNNQIFWFQPVHNIILLLVSEIGLVGFIFLIWWLIKRFNDYKFNKNNLLIFGIIFVSGMVDHYWFTLPQNMWLLTIIVALL
jgi:hypothetical protein